MAIKNVIARKKPRGRKCPECGKFTLYAYEPAGFRTGDPALERCSQCGYTRRK